MYRIIKTSVPYTDGTVKEKYCIQQLKTIFSGIFGIGKFTKWETYAWYSDRNVFTYYYDTKGDATSAAELLEQKDIAC